MRILRRSVAMLATIVGLSCGGQERHQLDAGEPSTGLLTRPDAAGRRRADLETVDFETKKKALSDKLDAIPVAETVEAGRGEIAERLLKTEQFAGKVPATSDEVRQQIRVYQRTSGLKETGTI